MNNLIGVTLNPGEKDTDNNFVDSNKGLISGSVTDEDGKPVKGVTLTLTDSDNETFTKVTERD